MTSELITFNHWELELVTESQLREVQMKPPNYIAMLAYAEFVCVELGVWAFSYYLTLWTLNERVYLEATKQ